LVGSNVMPLVKAQQLTTPCIIYAIDNVATNNSFAAASLADTYQVSFHIFDKEYDKAVQIARVLRNTIGFTCGKFGGWDFRMVRFENIQDTFQDAGQLYGQTLTFSVRVKNDPNFGLPKILRTTFTEVAQLVGAGVTVYPLQLLVNEAGYFSGTAYITEQLRVLFGEQGQLTGNAAVQELFNLAMQISEAGTLTARAVGASFELAFTEQSALTAQAQLALQLALVAAEQSELSATVQSAVALVAQFGEMGVLSGAAFNRANLGFDVVENGVFEGVGEVVEGAFDTDYQAVLDYATAQGWTLPSAPQQTKGNQLVVDLKAAGIWSKLYFFYPAETDGDVNFACINWKAPADSTNMIRFNSPIYNVNQGFKGDGVSSYLEIPYNPVTLGWSINNFAFGGFDFENRAGGEFLIADNALILADLRNSINPRNPSDALLVRHGNNSFITFSNTNSIGLYHLDRSISLDFNTAKSGVSLGNSILGSLGFHNGIFWALRVLTQYSQRRVGYLFAGTSFWADREAFSNAINTYRTGL